MIGRIDHIGIAVASLDDAVRFYETALGLRCLKREEVPDQKARVAFFDVGGTHIELLEPLAETGPIARFLERHGEGIHHLAFATDDIDAQLERAREAGCRLINERPVSGAGGKQIAFLHPRSTHGVLMELCARPGSERA